MSDRALLDYRPRHDDASVSSLSDAAPVSGLGSTNKEDRSSRPRTRRHTGKREWSLHAWLFGAVIAAILYFGWKRRDTGYLTPEEGLGYALGITGSCIMLILLLYPLRKRIRFMRG